VLLQDVFHGALLAVATFIKFQYFQFGPLWPFCGFDFEIDCGTWMHGGYELLLAFHVQTILPFDVHCQTSGTT
jgi:hypothetical protein